jgi:hypothetical protein
MFLERLGLRGRRESALLECGTGASPELLTAVIVADPQGEPGSTPQRCPSS